MIHRQTYRIHIWSFLSKCMILQTKLCFLSFGSLQLRISTYYLGVLFVRDHELVYPFKLRVMSLCVIKHQVYESGGIDELLTSTSVGY